MFITLEGGEGAGKSTQALRLHQRLLGAGYRARLTREPGGTPLAGAIRALILYPGTTLKALAAADLTSEGSAAEPLLPVSELLLLSSARAQHVLRIREWLDSGEIIVCDRYADATRVYQGVGRGLDAGTIEMMERLVTGGLTPDLTLLLDVPVEEGQRRRRLAEESGAQWNRLDAEAAPFHERVRQGYLALTAAEPERWVALDGTLLPDELERQIWTVVCDRLLSQEASTSSSD
ncbi:MAG: dTMP kinase [Ktedonobacterales bacterium]